MSDRPAQTARRWAYVTWLLVTAACAFVIVRSQAGIDDYERRVSLATVPIDGLVVATDAPMKGRDTVTVAWLDQGRERRRTFDVDDAADFAVGASFSLVREPGVDEVYPVDQERTRPTADLVTAITGTVLVLLGLQLPWLVRFNAWRRAARAPATTYRATLLLSSGRGGYVAVPWLRLVGPGGDVRIQRVMWEPWLVDWSRPVDVEVTARRAGSGPFVVDVPGRGRLWPAGPGRRRRLLLESLAAGTFTATSTRRWPTQILMGSICAAIVAVFFGASGEIDNVLLGGLVLGGVGVSVALFYSGAPFYRRAPR